MVQPPERDMTLDQSRSHAIPMRPNFSRSARTGLTWGGTSHVAAPRPCEVRSYSQARRTLQKSVQRRRQLRKSLRKHQRVTSLLVSHYHLQRSRIGKEIRSCRSVVDRVPACDERCSEVGEIAPVSLHRRTKNQRLPPEHRLPTSRKIEADTRGAFEGRSRFLFSREHPGLRTPHWRQLRLQEVTPADSPRRRRGLAPSLRHGG
jgi:hypothetical protein